MRASYGAVKAKGIPAVLPPDHGQTMLAQFAEVLNEPDENA